LLEEEVGLPLAAEAPEVDELDPEVVGLELAGVLLEPLELVLDEPEEEVELDPELAPDATAPTTPPTGDEFEGEVPLNGEFPAALVKASKVWSEVGFTAATIPPAQCPAVPQ